MCDDESTSYEIELTKKAVKDLKKIPHQQLVRIDKKILALEDEPRPQNSKKLTNEDDLHRIRVGDYRVIYAIDDDKNLVIIARIRHRSEAYDNL